MAMRSSLFVVLLLHGLPGGATDSFEYCVIGAGPGGLQLASLLHSRARSYVVFERSSASGSFFETYPRHRKLNSFNKAGKLRHDQHSLLGGRRGVAVADFSRDAHPDAGDYAAYLRAYSRDLRIRYNSDAILTREGDGYRATVDGTEHRCAVAVVATGLGVPNRLYKMRGLEHVDEYATMSVDPRNYTNQTVVVLGAGNSGFETAQALADTAAHVWLVGRNRVALAMESRYSGDVRAGVNGILDSYQLKSLDAVAESPGVADPRRDTAVIRHGGTLRFVDPGWVRKFPRQQAWRRATARKHSRDWDVVAEIHPTIGAKWMMEGVVNSSNHSLFAGRPAMWDPGIWYSDRVISCHGFRFNHTVFSGSPTQICSRRPCGPVPLTKLIEPLMHSGKVAVANASYPTASYPVLSSGYEAVAYPGLYFAGVLMHGSDYKRSSGNMVHGFRHSVEALFNWLELTRHGSGWPANSHDVRFPAQLATVLLGMAGDAAASYSMHGELLDVVALHPNGTAASVEGVPRGLVDVVVPNPHMRLLVEFRWGENASAPPHQARERRVFLAAEIDRLQKELASLETAADVAKRMGESCNRSSEIAERKRLIGAVRHERRMTNNMPQLFGQGRHPLKQSDAARSYWLHPVVRCACREGDAREHHIAESADGEYDSMLHHVLPLVNFLQAEMEKCSNRTPDVDS
eukprot:TRINITY_DN20095_c0_g1_i4.p1 TRINITY_DN20095_c0_g1~~TRINITY_DN20095_c0_g1_i4.p1  ORF type:complete len:688 (-),score=75.95 TRINITY_DN20095_c0_g1_i4:376-2439(-)